MNISAAREWNSRAPVKGAILGEWHWRPHGIGTWVSSRDWERERERECLQSNKVHHVHSWTLTLRSQEESIVKELLRERRFQEEMTGPSSDRAKSSGSILLAREQLWSIGEDTGSLDIPSTQGQINCRDKETNVELWQSAHLLTESLEHGSLNNSF